MFEGVNAIQGILCLVYHGSIQIIANIPGSESPDCVRIRNVECLNGCVNGILLENQVTEKLYKIIRMNIIIMMKFAHRILVTTSDSPLYQG